MQVPAGFLGNFRVAVRTQAVLFVPKPEQFIVPVQVVFHLISAALLKVRFPCGVVRIGGGVELDVPFDGRINCSGQPDGARFPAPVRVAGLKDVVISIHRVK